MRARREMIIPRYTFHMKSLLAAACCLLFMPEVHADTNLRKHTVDLYGHMLQFDYSSSARGAVLLNDSHAISSWVSAYDTDAETDTLLARMNAYAVMLDMDDMAFLIMLDKFTEKVFRKDEELLKRVFKYTLLSKRGLDVFLGYNDHHITLYGRTNFAVDNCLFISQGNKKYFDLSFDQLQQPETETPFFYDWKKYGKKRPLVMNMIHPPAFNAKIGKRILPFEYDGLLYFFKCNVNQSLVDYYRDLPTVNISTVYLNYGFSAAAKGSFIEEIKEAVAGMPTGVAVDFMLKFVQQAFTYKKDEEVYGCEKFSFPEETICNRYSDCEDKAMLFAYLVNEVLGLKTVGLYYKNSLHINIAIENWKHDLKGNFTFNDHDYIVCEPSGTGFLLGESSNKLTYASLIDW